MGWRPASLCTWPDDFGGPAVQRPDIEGVETEAEARAEPQGRRTGCSRERPVLPFWVEHPAVPPETAFPPDEGLYKRRLAPADLPENNHIGACQFAFGIALPRVEAEQPPGGFATDVAAVDPEVVGDHEGVERAQLDGGGPVGRREPSLPQVLSSS